MSNPTTLENPRAVELASTADDHQRAMEMLLVKFYVNGFESHSKLVDPAETEPNGAEVLVGQRVSSHRSLVGCTCARLCSKKLLCINTGGACSRDAPSILRNCQSSDCPL